MALTATIFKANLNVADLDRHYYADHALTLARHPSETDERMMVRALAFALHADDHLAFGRGIGAADEPDLWRRDLTGRVELWIEVGLPEERRVRKACGLADRVVVYAYGGRSVDLWWSKSAPELARCRNLEVIVLGAETTRRLSGGAERRMELQLTVQDGDAWMTCGESRFLVERTWLQGRESA